MKRKLLLFHTSLATYRIDLFNRLNREFDAVFYFEQKRQLDHSFGRFSEDYLESKCQFNCHYLDKGFRLIGRTVKLGVSKVIRREAPDIVICYEYSPITVVSFLHYLITGKKFKMFTISDDSLENSRGRKGIRRFIRNMVSKNIDGVIFTSELVGNWYRENISDQVKVLELPIIHDDDIFRSELRESLDLANLKIESYKLENQKVILFVGRLVPLKNLDPLLSVLSTVYDDEWKCVIVGDGELMGHLKDQVKVLGIDDRILFTGNLEGAELHSWFCLANIFVLPSTFEQYGAVVNESLLAGCFTLCSSLAGAATLINGHNGIIFNPRSRNELKKSIESGLKKEHKIGSKITAIRKSKMPFTFEEKISLLIKSLNNVCDR